MIDLRVLGDARLSDGNRSELESVVSQPKRLALLVYLCLSGRGGFVRRDTLVALFWPESDEEHARAALSQSLYFLRRALGAEVIVGRGVEELGVDLTRLGCDAVSFRDRLEQGNLDGALDLYADELLPGLHVDSPEADRWLDEERSSLRGAALGAALELGTGAVDKGDYQRARSRFERGLQIAPESEAAAYGLVESLWREGRRTAALDAHERFTVRLAEEYGVEPGADLQALIERVRKGSPARSSGQEIPATVAVTPEVDTDDSSTSRSPIVSRPRTTRDWLRLTSPFALGIVAILLLAGWLGRTTAMDDSAWYYSNQEYLKAWAAWDAQRYDEAQALAQGAVELDSTHARAWALLSYTGALLNAFDQGQPSDLLPSAYQAGRRAVLADDAIAAPWVARAVTRWTYRREWESAERNFRYALELSPGARWEALARIDLSALLENLGRCEEAREVLEPYAAADPRDRIFGSSVVVRLSFMCRDYEEAITRAERAIASGDTTFFTRQILFLSRLQSGDLAGAEEELRVLREASPDLPLLPFYDALLAARDGRGSEARELIERHSDHSAAGVYVGQTGVLRAESLAQLYAAVGDRDNAFAVLTAAFENKGHVRRLSSHPLFDPLRGDPRYDALLARMGLRCRPDGDLYRCRPLE